MLSVQESTATEDRAETTGKISIKDIKNKIKILSLMKKEPDFSEVLTSARRVYNILGKGQHAEVKKDLLLEPAEKDLFNAAREVNDKLMGNDYKALFELSKPINTFFDSVLVMDKKPEIKENRLALLATVRKVFDSLGDFSKIVE